MTFQKREGEGGEGEGRGKRGSHANAKSLMLGVDSACLNGIVMSNL